MHIHHCIYETNKQGKHKHVAGIKSRVCSVVCEEGGAVALCDWLV